MHAIIHIPVFTYYVELLDRWTDFMQSANTKYLVVYSI